MKKFKTFIRKVESKDQTPFVGFIGKVFPKPVKKKKFVKKKSFKESLDDVDHLEKYNFGGLLSPEKVHEHDAKRKEIIQHAHTLNQLATTHATHPDKDSMIHYLRRYSTSSGSSKLNLHLLRNHGVKNIAKSKTYYEKNNEEIDNSQIPEAIHHLKKAIALHSTSKDMHVFSGTTYTPEHSAKKHQELHLPAFTSTSLEASTAKNFASPVASSEHIYDHHERKVDKHGFHNEQNVLKGLAKIKSDAHRKHMDSWDHNKLAHSDETAKSLEKAQDKYERYNLERKYKGSQYRHVMHIHVPEGSHALYASPHSYHEHEKEVLLHPGAKLKINTTPTIDHDSKVVYWHSKLIHDGVKPTKFAEEKHLEKV